MKNCFKFVLAIHIFNFSYEVSASSHFEKYKNRALVNYSAQEVSLSSQKYQKVKQSMLEHSQDYLHNVWQNEPLSENRSAQDWDIAFMRTQNGLLKALLVSKNCGYSFIHDVPEHIKQDVGL